MLFGLLLVMVGVLSPSPLVGGTTIAQQTLCNRTCSALSRSEGRHDFRKIGCALLDTRLASSVSPFLCGDLPKHPLFEYYLRMETAFLNDVLSHPSFRVSIGVIFKLGDNGTLSTSSERYLYNEGLAFLSQAHVIVPTELRKLYILQPDFNFIHTKGFRSLIARMTQGCPPFRSRAKVVFWRGSSTSRVGPTCDAVPRVRMCKKAESMSWVDAKITKYLRFCSNRDSSVPQVPEVEWCQRRGIVDIDGNAFAWGLFWRLASGSAVFRVESSFDCSYCGELRPWVHYVPISRSLDDMSRSTSVILNESHSAELIQMTRRARNLIDRHTYDKEVVRVVGALNHFSTKRLQRKRQ